MTKTEYTGMIFSYIRVSTPEQSLERQIELINNRFPKIHHVFQDIGTGRNMHREQFEKMNLMARAGDTIVCESLSRLSRNTKQLRLYIEELNSKGIKLICLKENIDTQDKSGMGKLLLDLLITLTEFEINISRERQMEGIKIAQIKGKYKGRKPIQKPENFDYYYQFYKNKKNNKNEPFGLIKLMEATKLKKNTCIKFIKMEQDYEKKQFIG